MKLQNQAHIVRVVSLLAEGGADLLLPILIRRVAVVSRYVCQFIIVLVASMYIHCTHSILLFMSQSISV